MNDDRLIDAYRRTTWRVADAGERITTGDAAGSDALFARTGARTAAIVTAWNPGSRRLDTAANDRRNAELVDAIERGGWPFEPCVGAGPDDDAMPWSEDSFVVFDITRNDAILLGHQFGQNAIVWLESGSAPTLVVTKDGFAGLPAGGMLCASISKNDGSERSPAKVRVVPRAGIPRR